MRFGRTGLGEAPLSMAPWCPPWPLHLLEVFLSEVPPPSTAPLGFYPELPQELAVTWCGVSVGTEWVGGEELEWGARELVLVNIQRLYSYPGRNLCFAKCTLGISSHSKLLKLTLLAFSQGVPLKDYERSTDSKTTNPRLPRGTDTSERKWFSQANL